MSKNFCPFIKGKCKEGDCKFWVHLIGKNPQSTDHIDRWDCTLTWLPVLLTENSQMIHQTSAAVDKFTNTVDSGMKQIAVAAHNASLPVGHESRVRSLTE